MKIEEWERQKLKEDEVREVALRQGGSIISDNAELIGELAGASPADPEPRALVEDTPPSNPLSLDNETSSHQTLESDRTVSATPDTTTSLDG
jgi:hypothetical protein